MTTFRVDADAYQYRLARVRTTRKEDGTEVEREDVTFHRTLRQVAHRIAEYEMRESVQAAADVTQAAERFDAAVDRIEATLTEDAIARCMAAHPAGAR